MGDDVQKVNDGRLNELIKLNKELSKDQIKENPDGDEEKLRIMNKNIDRLRREEDDLKEQLELQKKENFSLQASIDSLQTTLEKRLGDLKDAESELDDIYEGIWSERENFCVKADEINEEFGIMSNWWRTQLEFVSDLENLRKKRASNKKSKKEIEVCQDNLTKIGKEINVLLKEKKESEFLARGPESGDSANEMPENMLDEPMTSETKLYPIFKPLKKVKFSESVDKMEMPAETDQFVNDKFFEMMNVEKVRMINKKKTLKKIK